MSEIVSYVMEKERPHSRAWYRMNAIRNMTGSAKLEPQLDEKTNEVYTLTKQIVSRWSVKSKPQRNKKQTPLNLT